MRKIFLAAFLSGLSVLAFSKSASSASPLSAAAFTDQSEAYESTIDRGEHPKDSTVRIARRPGRISAGLSFGSLDLGLAKLVDNGKGTLSPENEFLHYRPWKSVNVGFDVVKVSYRVSDQFRIAITPGFDWTFFRLKQDVIIQEDTRPLTYSQSDIHYSKNRFGTSYLKIPLSFEFRSKAASFSDRVRISAGPIGGLLIQGSQKFKSSEQGKKKNVDDFNFMPFRYGGFFKISYGSVGVYVKYYMNDVFQNSPDQEGLKNVSFGLTLGL